MRKLTVLLATFLYATAAHAAKPHYVDVEIGQAVDLSAYGGPNVQLIVTSSDSYNVSYTTVDFDRQRVVISGTYDSVSGSSQPTQTRQQVERHGEKATLLFRRGGVAVFYVESEARMNHVVLGIVKDQVSQ